MKMTLNVITIIKKLQQLVKTEVAKRHKYFKGQSLHIL